MTLTHSLRIALFAGVSFAAMGHGVLAQDADDFTAKIKAAYDAFGYDLQFGTATADGDTITIDGLTVVITTLPEPMEPYTLDTVLTFSGVTQLDDGSYKVAELTVPDVDITIDGDRVVVQSIAFRNLYIPGSDNPTILEALSVFERNVFLITIPPLPPALAKRAAYALWRSEYALLAKRSFQPRSSQ